MAKPINPPITDHNERAIARLPGFTLESPNINKLIRALNGGKQDLEDVLDDFLRLQAISTSVGVQLDNIGTILDLARVVGQSDASYSSDLLGRAGSLSQSGTMDQLLDVYDLLFVPLFIYATDLHPATFQFTAVLGVDSGDPSDAEVIAAMGKAKAAGVEMILQVVVPSLSLAFLWGAEADADVNGDLPAAATGFGAEADADVNGDISPGDGGGNLARVLV